MPDKGEQGNRRLSWSVFSYEQIKMKTKHEFASLLQRGPACLFFL